MLHFFVTGNVAGGPMAYVGNLAFQIKTLLILIAAINLVACCFTGIAPAAAAGGRKAMRRPQPKSSLLIKSPSSALPLRPVVVSRPV